METKTCLDCGFDKPLDDYGKNSNNKDGKQSRCRACYNIKQRKYWNDNREKMNRLQNDWRKRNPEKRKAQHLRYNEAHREERVATARKWGKENPERRAQIKGSYRARKRSEALHVLPREIRRLKASPCAVCGSQGPVDIDHVIPLAKGGRHSIGNLQPLCHSCNCSKSDKFFAEWLYKVVPVRLSA